MKTMLVKLLLYIFFTFVSAFGLSGINFDGIIKANKTIEAKVLVMVLNFSFPQQVWFDYKYLRT